MDALIQEVIREMVLPTHPKNPSNVPSIECVKFVRELPGQSPSLRSVKKDRQHTGGVKTELGPDTDLVVVTGSFKRSKGATGFTDTDGNIGRHITRRVDGAPQVAEFIYEFNFFPTDVNTLWCVMVSRACSFVFAQLT